MDYIEDHILDQTWTNIQNHPKKKKFKVARKAGYDAALSLLCVYIVDLKQT